METQEQQDGTANIIAELNATISELKNKVASLSATITWQKSAVEREKTQHEYLQTMYDDLLAKLINK